MRKCWKGIGVAGLGGLALAPVAIRAADDVAQVMVPGMHLVAQYGDRLCWAATGQILMEHLGIPNVSQCQQAENLNVANGLPCCDHSRSPMYPIYSYCDQQGFLDFGDYHVLCSMNFGALPWETLATSYYNQSPTAFRWYYQGQNFYHFSVAYGVTAGGTLGKQVLIFDTRPKSVVNGLDRGDAVLISYSQWYVSDPAGTDHFDSRDYYNIHK